VIEELGVVGGLVMGMVELVGREIVWVEIVERLGWAGGAQESVGRKFSPVRLALLPMGGWQ
jgi:hypothetical protein